MRCNVDRLSYVIDVAGSIDATKTIAKCEQGNTGPTRFGRGKNIAELDIATAHKGKLQPSGNNTSSVNHIAKIVLDDQDRVLLVAKQVQSAHQPKDEEPNS